jgi:hypothetical protein
MTVVGCGMVTALVKGSRGSRGPAVPSEGVRDPLGDRGHGPRSGQGARRRGGDQSRERESPTTTAPRVGQGRQKRDEIYRIEQRLR